MNTDSKRVLLYKTNKGSQPYADWFKKLKDVKTKAIILKRIERLILGNLGDCKALKEGIHELRIDYGPGFRVYFAQEGEDIILLIAGGDKSTQTQDIEKAKEYYHDHTARLNSQL